MHCGSFSSHDYDDYYQILGISRDANFVKIKKAYNALVLKCHPDKNSKGHEKFLIVQNAYDRLKELFEDLSQGEIVKLILIFPFE